MSDFAYELMAGAWYGLVAIVCACAAIAIIAGTFIALRRLWLVSLKGF